QAVHQDTAVFQLFPPNYIVGAWIACEDIAVDSGPLMYYPKSHREQLFEAFNNYPQTSLRTASSEVTNAYLDYVNNLASKHRKQLFLGKKGDVFLWHGMLLHGGSEVQNPSQTRQSYVVHFVPPDKEVSSQILGPLNW
ncbi:MAG: phytanoyl-CoA dioxygenase family protein, partial [Cyanobacteria bacterium Co-bin13]|nr:phytanoyl-CoA dioxygenase family protein [Cyanobacteria bacterium Co-bin13]